MKRFICALCSLAIIIACIAGCNQSSENPFTADDAIKGQIGDLYYVVPNNAIIDEQYFSDIAVKYNIPIKNSTEEYQLNLIYTYVSEDDASEDEALNGFETIINDLITKSKENESNGISYESEPITEFLGTTVDLGLKYTAEGSGQKVIGIVAAKSRTLYFIGYSVKTGFYDQSVWDNFYAQLKLV